MTRSGVRPREVARPTIEVKVPASNTASESKFLRRLDPGSEDGAPNNGDGSGDGVQDSTQSNVASTPDPTGGYITVAAPDGVALSDVNVASPGAYRHRRRA